MAIAADVGLDVQRLRRDMENPAIEEYLDETIRLARTLGINGTPAFVIGDTLVPGAVDGARLKELIAWPGPAATLSWCSIRCPGLSQVLSWARASSRHIPCHNSGQTCPPLPATGKVVLPRPKPNAPWSHEHQGHRSNRRHEGEQLTNDLQERAPPADREPRLRRRQHDPLPTYARLRPRGRHQAPKACGGCRPPSRHRSRPAAVHRTREHRFSSGRRTIPEYDERSLPGSYR